MDRRELFASIAATGIGSVVFHRALTCVAQDETPAEREIEVTAEMVQAAEWVSGTSFDAATRQRIARSVNSSLADRRRLRAQEYQQDLLPALHFRTLAEDPAGRVVHDRAPAMSEEYPPVLPTSDDEIAFLPVTELAALIRHRKLTSLHLTQLYLRRLKKFDPMLKCVVNLTEDLAIEQAKRADQEIAAGRYRGPLHGIPWGAKDLMAVDGYPTTWGIPQFRDRVIQETCTVARRLEEAGAVLVAKLSLGAIAMGDKWFGGKTRSPWNPQLGSSGSSAGSASATVAGLVGFSIGSETLGSIVSPSKRCGATGLRPTFGSVSRHGCMPLSWSMDKLGPITRGVEDCALVFAAIQGIDGKDPTVRDFPFTWPPQIDFSKVKIGYTRGRQTADERRDLEVLTELGGQLVEVELPAIGSEWFLANIIDVEGAAVFDEMLRAGDTEGWNEWTRIFQAAEFVSALDYLRMQRRRRELMLQFEKVMESIDLLVNAADLLITNLTGHPSVVFPTGYLEGAGGARLPRSTVLTGHLHDESRLLAVGLAYQRKMSAHLERPPLDSFWQQYTEKNKPVSEESDSSGGGSN